MARKKVPFDDAKAVAAAKNARSFHAVASEVNESYQRSVARVAGRGSQPAEVIEQIVGQVAAVALLDALALELTLKVRVHRAGKLVPATHDHCELFGELTDREKQDLEQRYAERRHPSMASTLEGALTKSASVFVEWRYMFEHSQPTAYTSEMQVTYDLLQEDL